MKKILVVIDTNVLVSALLTKHFDSATVKVLELLFDSKIIPLFNGEIIEEYNEVLHRDKFNFSNELIDNLIQFICDYGIFSERLHTEDKFVDLKDLVFYEVCMAKRKKGSFLVTGNIKHFPEKSFIVTPNELLKIINKTL